MTKTTRFSWKKLTDTLYQTELDNKTYQIHKYGKVWEVVEIVSGTYHYLTNAKGIIAAKKITSDLYHGKIYLDENCVPKKTLKS